MINNPILESKITELYEDNLNLFIKGNNQLKAWFYELPEQLKPHFLKLINEDMINGDILFKNNLLDNSAKTVQLNSLTKENICFKFPPLNDNKDKFKEIMWDLRLDWRPYLEIEVLIPEKIIIKTYRNTGHYIGNRTNRKSDFNPNVEFKKIEFLWCDILKNDYYFNWFSKEIIKILTLFCKEFIFKTNISIYLRHIETLEIVKTEDNNKILNLIKDIVIKPYKENNIKLKSNIMYSTYADYSPYTYYLDKWIKLYEGYPDNIKR